MTERARPRHPGGGYRQDMPAISPTDLPGLLAGGRLATLLPTPAHIRSVATALQAAMDAHPDGHPDLPPWVQRLYAQGPAVLAEGIVALHLAALIAELTRNTRARWTPEALTAGLGVALTVTALAPETVGLGRFLQSGLDSVGARGGGSALFPAELPQAGLTLLHLAGRAGLSLPEAFTNGSLPVLMDLLEQTGGPVTVQALTPVLQGPPTERQARFLRLAVELQDSGVTDHAGWPVPDESLDPATQVTVLLGLAGLLGLWVDARTGTPGLDVTGTLTWAANAVHVAQALSARHQLPAGPGRAVLADLTALHRGTRCAPLDALRSGACRPVDLSVQTEAWHALRRARHVALTGATERTRHTEVILWDVMDTLERRALPRTVMDEALLALAARWALLTSPRAAGMPLPALADVACALSGVHPDWAWPLRDRAAEVVLEHALASLVMALMSQRLYPGDQELRLVVHALVGHAAAAGRRCGTTLPEADVLEAHLRAAGLTRPLRSVPLGTPAVQGQLDRMHKRLEALDVQEEPGSIDSPVDLEGPTPTQAEPAQAERALSEGFAVRPAVPRATPSPEAPHVRQVRALLKGKRVVLLGGMPYAEHHRALVDALGLGELDWIPSARYDNGQQAAAHVRRPGTALVIFALRWGAHAHGSIRDVARACGVPFVLHPSGLNPNQVAWQILQQASDALGTPRLSGATP